MTPEFDCKCLAFGVGKCFGCRANEAIALAVAAERERCVEAAKKVCDSLNASSRDYGEQKNYGDALRALVRCDGALLVMLAICEGK